MKLEISEKDFGKLCICAIRYCHGRETYMPSLVRKIISEHFENISDNDLRIMIEDCSFQKEFELYGDEIIDKPGWLIWEETLKEEAKKRGM